MENFAGGFFVGWLESDKDWFWPFEPFSMLKTFCKTLIKIKLAWPVCTEYEIKMSYELWPQLKMKFYWVITWKLLLSGGGGNEPLMDRNKNLVWGESTKRRFFLVGEWANFLQVGGWANFPQVGGLHPSLPGSHTFKFLLIHDL